MPVLSDPCFTAAQPNISSTQPFDIYRHEGAHHLAHRLGDQQRCGKFGNKPSFLEDNGRSCHMKPCARDELTNDEVLGTLTI
jgi:hypothetical protein